jgi:hypothetical protein
MRISVPLDKAELTALATMAATDCRHPREQMRFLLREEARRRGLLAANPAKVAHQANRDAEVDDV